MLQRNGNRAFHSLRAGANVEAVYGNLRRRQVGKLRNWQRGNDHGAPENNHQGANRGEYRTMNEKVNEHEKVGLRASSFRRQAKKLAETQPEFDGGQNKPSGLSFKRLKL